MESKPQKSGKTSRSGKDIGLEYLNRVKEYLNSGQQPPLSINGEINFTALADRVGIPRQSLYKNPAIRALIIARKASAPQTCFGGTDEASPDGDSNKGYFGNNRPTDIERRRKHVLERRINYLEQQNASLIAENSELRYQLKSLRLQYGREDMMLESGRRIVSSPADHV